MKILQINECCNGSTGSSMINLACRIRDKGFGSYVAYGQGCGTYSDSYCIGTRFEKLFHSLVFTRILGLHGYGSIFSTYRFLRWVDKIKPDIIHLRNLHTNFINYPMLYRYIIKHKIPVVMTLHDCYNFTGQCEHYVGVGCNKFTRGCGKCPFLHHTIAPSWFFDWSHWLIQQKHKWYSQINNMTVIGVSNWLKREADKSILSGHGHVITCIYNWVDTKQFYPRPKDEIAAIREKYNLDSNTKYLITVSAAWKSDTTKYNEMVELANKLPQGYSLVIVGSVVDGTAFPDSVKNIGYTESRVELAALYTLAEAYIHLSVCDTFGKVIAEAMACGTIPIVYDSTAIPEVTGRLGVIVKPHDVDAIVDAICNLPRTDINRGELITYVKENYNGEKNMDQYLNVYQKILYNEDQYNNTCL